MNALTPLSSFVLTRFRAVVKYEVERMVFSIASAGDRPGEFEGIHIVFSSAS